MFVFPFLGIKETSDYLHKRAILLNINPEGN